jgi:hypothetical protein
MTVRNRHELMKSDAELAAAALAGETQAFAPIVER